MLSPEVTPEEAPEVTPEEAPEVSSEEAPEVSSEVTPEEAPEEAPEVTPEVTPEVSSEVTPRLRPGPAAAVRPCSRRSGKVYTPQRIRYGAASFAAEATVASDPRVTQPAIARRDDLLVVAWVDGGRVKVRVRDGGRWLAARTLGEGAAPSLAANRDAFGLVWHREDGGGAVLFSRLGASGTWSTRFGWHPAAATPCPS